MIFCLMLTEAAVFRVTAEDIPIVQPRDFVQLTLQILIVLSSAIENTVDRTTLCPLRLRETHFEG